MNTTYNLSISNSEKISLMTSFSTMLSAGIPILEIVDSLLEDTKGNQKKILETVRNDLSQGRRLHMSFAQFPNVFDKVSVNIIKAAEEAGTLETTLKDLRESILKEIEFSDKIKSALSYPIMILVVFLGVLLMVLLFVIPKISQVFSRMRMNLPLPTQIMIFVSNLLLTYTIPIIIGLVAVTALTVYLFKTQKKKLLNFLFSLPVISRLAKEIDLTRFARVLSMLLNAGLPITVALDLCEEVVVKKEISQAIAHLKEIVLTGKRLSEGLKDSKRVIPSLMVKITEAGEKSGSLEKSMQEISQYLDYQVGKSIKSATTMLEPLMMVFMGILIGGMMLAIMAPIYSMIGQVGGR